MRKRDKPFCLFVSVMLMAIFRSPVAVGALELPVSYWDVRGTVKDWSTKQPVAGALILVFLNGASVMKFDFNPEQSDYPDLPRTSTSGQFTAKAVLYQTRPNTRLDRLEVIVFAPGYRTERFSFSSSEGKLSEDGTLRTIDLPEIELAKYQDLVGSEQLVHDAKQAERVARLTIQRNQVDTSGRNMETPESVEEVTHNGRKAWRVIFGSKQPVDGPRVVGGELMVLIDAATGQSEIMAGE